MKAFCIFDDFPSSCVEQLENVGISMTVLKRGHSRPSDEEMRHIFEMYNIVIIGTSQRIYSWMWQNVTEPRIVATASVGIDHIHVPEDKSKLLTILNTPKANAQSVAEYTIGAMLMSRKRFVEGNVLYQKAQDNKSLSKKPEDVHGSVVGLVGAGKISTKIMELLSPFGVELLCFTKNPGRHTDLSQRFGTEFVDLETLTRKSDIISVNVPSDPSTRNLISAKLVAGMKDDGIFISVSRASVVDIPALIAKSEANFNFYTILDMDVDSAFVGKNNGRNIIITPHIAGGTIATRQRMFVELTERLMNKIGKCRREYCGH